MLRYGGGRKGREREGKERKGRRRERKRREVKSFHFFFLIISLSFFFFFSLSLSLSLKMAKKAGYDGVEVMGSEGYLINEFLVEKTNKRNDEYGGLFSFFSPFVSFSFFPSLSLFFSNHYNFGFPPGGYENRMRFATEIVSGIRKNVGNDFIIIFRLSMMDLVTQVHFFFFFFFVVWMTLLIRSISPLTS